ncbi:MAG: phosphatase domain-containing protein [Methylophilaceae bacterium]
MLSNIDQINANQAQQKDEIVLYPACITHMGGIIEGRIIKRRKIRQFAFEDGWRKNLTRSLSYLINSERKCVPFSLTIGEFDLAGTTDDEGYLKVTIPLNHLSEGWHTVSVKSKLGLNTQQCLVLSTQVTSGVITDLDDTILVSEVTKKLRLLTNTFLKNPLQRKAVLGAAQVYQQLSLQPHTPIFYLSATPRQLYHFVEGFLRHYEFPAGMIITRRLTQDAFGDSLNIKTYKTQKIESIFAALPHMKFKLMGDDGEHDPDIYHDLQTRFPHQVEGVWIRRIVHSTLKYRAHQDFETLIEPLS